MTAGFVGAEHIPNVAMTIGEKSWIVATVLLVPLTMLGVRLMTAGSVPKEHFAWPPMTTISGTLAPRAAANAGSECPPARVWPQDVDGAERVPDRARAGRQSKSRGRAVSLVRLEGVVREIGTFVILDRIDAAIAPGERIGLVGPERRRQDDAAPDRRRAGTSRTAGPSGRRRGLTIGLLEPGGALRRGVHGRARTSAPRSATGPRTSSAWPSSSRGSSTRATPAGTDYADLQHRFDILGGYTLDLRVDEALSGLGFARDEWLRPPTALSGGQQTRAALARLVIADPDLLMLDEPTNHLDISAIEWLEEHLRRRSGALLVASHDRAFLDATVDARLGAPRPPPDGVPWRLQRLSPAARSSATRGPSKEAEHATPTRSSARSSSSSATAASAST